MVQDIPSPPTIYSHDPHNMTSKGKIEIDWRDKNILSWNNRLQFVNIIGNICLGIIYYYTDWYANITRPKHTCVVVAQSHMVIII